LNSKQILIRAGKDPRAPIDAYETFRSNLIGNNNGNLMFATASHKLLTTQEQNVTAHGLSFHPNHAAGVNERYDHVVLPLANAFRKSFQPQLEKLTDFIEKLKIPVTMLSGGAQSGNDGTFANLKPIDESVKRFCRAVLERSPQLSVRGQRTADYLDSLGIRDVEVIGCPSLTMFGREHEVPDPDLGKLSKVAYNVETSKDVGGNLIEEAERGFSASYFAQDMATFELMLHGKDRFGSNRDDRLPLRSSHRAFTDDRARFALDAWTWIDGLKDYDFAFGPRIHGSVAAVLARTPTILVAHDSRTVELAEVHAIPYLTPERVLRINCVEELATQASFSKFNNRHPENFDRLVSFVHRQGLKTIYDDDQTVARTQYEQQVDATNFPPLVRTAWAAGGETLRERLAHGRDVELELAMLRSEVKSLKSELRSIRKGLSIAVSKG
jgi:hypothetical protein